MTRPFRSAFLAIACAIGASSAVRAAEPIDMPALLRSAETAVAATVLLIPPMSIYRNPVTEAELQQESCRYATVDAPAIRALVGLLKNAGVAAAPVYQKPDIREAVYLTLADGGRLNFFVQDNNGGRLPVLGVVETSTSGQLRSNAITAQSTLSTDLRTWAAKSGGTGDGAACNRRSVPIEAPDAPR